MKTKLSKKEIEQKAEKFFKEIKSKTPKEIRKMKRLAMSKNIKLGNKKDLFCKKCLHPHISPKTRIKNKVRTIQCEKCDYISRKKLK